MRIPPSDPKGLPAAPGEKPGAPSEGLQQSAGPQPRGGSQQAENTPGAGELAPLTPADGEGALQRGAPLRRFTGEANDNWRGRARAANDAPPPVHLDRLRVQVAVDGSLKLLQDSRRPIAVPRARLELKNRRTKETFEVTLTGSGTLSKKGLALQGKPGDTFVLTLRPPRGGRSTPAGQIEVPGRDDKGRIDMPDPGPHPDDVTPGGKPRFEVVRFGGPLFVGPTTAEDVQQGYLADCYLSAAMSALAHARPSEIRKRIKDNKDGTYTVTFRDIGWIPPPDVVIRVDGDLYVDKKRGTPLYGRAGNGDNPKKMEMWYPILEKAYAAWKGNYHKIGEGGDPGWALEEFADVKSVYVDVKDEVDPEKLYRDLKRRARDKEPMIAMTYGKAQARRYPRTGIFSDHTYAILGVGVEKGQKVVKMRNPWGEGEPGCATATDGKDDGIFSVDMKTFIRLFESVAAGERND